jgi:hypothetical protein
MSSADNCDIQSLLPLGLGNRAIPLLLGLLISSTKPLARAGGVVYYFDRPGLLDPIRILIHLPFSFVQRLLPAP